MIPDDYPPAPVWLAPMGLCGVLPLVGGALMGTFLGALGGDGVGFLVGAVVGWVLTMLVMLLMAVIIERLKVRRQEMRFKPAGHGQPLETAAGQLATLAVLIGGNKRAWRAEEFFADLTGTSTTKHTPSAWAQVRHASGLIYGATVMRVRDLRKFLLRRLDWALAQPRLETLTATVGVVAAAYFVRIGGFAGLLKNLQNVISAAGLVYGPGFWLRGQREIPPAKRPVPTEHADSSAGTKRVDV